MLQYLYNATDANEIYVTGYIYTNTVGTIKNLPNNDRGLLIVFALDEVKYWVFQIAITFNNGNPKCILDSIHHIGVNGLMYNKKSNCYITISFILAIESQSR